MLLLATVKDYLNIPTADNSYDSFISSYITKAYAEMGDLLSLTITDNSGTENYTQTWYHVDNGDGLEANLAIKSVVSVVDGDGASVTYDNDRDYIEIDDTTISEDKIVGTYEGFVSNKLADCAMLYVLYWFNKRQDQRNDMFVTSKHTENGLTESNIPYDTFRNQWEAQVLSVCNNGVG